MRRRGDVLDETPPEIPIPQPDNGLISQDYHKRPEKKATIFLRYYSVGRKTPPTEPEKGKRCRRTADKVCKKRRKGGKRRATSRRADTSKKVCLRSHAGKGIS